MPIGTTLTTLTSLAATGMSFAQAAKQRDLQKKAELQAEESMKKARRALEKNYFEGIAIPKESYDISKEILKSTGQLGIETAKEADPRQLAATVARVQQQGLAAGQALGAQLEKQMFDLDVKQAVSAGQARDKGVILDVGEVQGAQKAAAVAEARAAKAMQQGFEGLTAVGKDIFGMIPEYGKGEAGRKLSRAERQAGGFEPFKAAAIEAGVQGITDDTSRLQLLSILKDQDLEELNLLTPFSETKFGQSNVGQALSDIGGFFAGIPGTVAGLFQKKD